MSIQIPADKEIFEGEIASYWLEGNILISLSKNPKRTVESISRNVELVKRITGNRPMPLLIYLCNSPVPDKATRRFSAQQLPLIYKAMAMVSDSALSKLVMNMVFGLTSPPIPMKSFSDDTEAREWLKQFE